MDNISEVCNELIKDEEFATLNTTLGLVASRFSEGHSSLGEVIAYLTATLPAKTKLPFRQSLWNAVAKNHRNLLKGL